MFGSQGPEAVPDVSNTGPKGTRASPAILGTGASSIDGIREGRFGIIGAQNVGLLGSAIPPASNYPTSASSSDSEGESATRYEVTTPFRSPDPSRIGPGPNSRGHQTHLDLLRRAYPPRDAMGDLRPSRNQTTPRTSHVSSHSRAGSTRSGS